MMRLSDLLTAAGAITLLRLGFAVTAPFWVARPDAVGFYAAAILSDLLDGFVARRTGTTTRAGAVFDAWVDKILHVNLGWSLAIADRIPDAWLLAWCARELIQAPLVPVLAYRFRTARAPPPRTSWWGRATAVSLSVAVGAVLVGADARFATALTGAFGVVAGIAYAGVYLPRRAPSLGVPAYTLEASAGSP